MNIYHYSFINNPKNLDYLEKIKDNSFWTEILHKESLYLRFIQNVKIFPIPVITAQQSARSALLSIKANLIASWTVVGSSS